jgi:hypothetical protein
MNPLMEPRRTQRSCKNDKCRSFVTMVFHGEGDNCHLRCPICRRKQDD